MLYSATVNGFNTVAMAEQHIHRHRRRLQYFSLLPLVRQCQQVGRLPSVYISLYHHHASQTDRQHGFSEQVEWPW